MNHRMQMKEKLSLIDPLKLTASVDAPNRCSPDFDDIFDKPCFLEQLRLEKNRAQRSGTALSLIQITHKKFKAEDSENLNGLLKTIKSNIRETDIAGYIDQLNLGVLLPYTDKEGAKIISEKIGNGFIKNQNQFSISISTFPDQMFDSLAKKGCISTDELGFMFEDSNKQPPFKLFLKRLVDVVGSIVAMLILSPIMLLTALLIKFNSPGPIVFKQTRLGKKGIPFTFYKFRSMRTDTNDQIHREYIFKLIDGNHSAINNGNNEKPLYKIKSDPRVTRVGKFIRKTSIDELPQFYNVLKGDMSLVGPRPPLAYEAEKYQAWHLRRILEMKPGITGLWQVEGRSRTGFDDAVRLDVRYLQTWSLLLDIKILFKTVKEVLLCRGAV